MNGLTHTSEPNSKYYSDYYKQVVRTTIENEIRMNAEKKKIIDFFCEKIKEHIDEKSLEGEYKVRLKMNVIEFIKLNFEVSISLSTALQQYINQVRKSFQDEGFVFNYIELDYQTIEITVEWERIGEFLLEPPTDDNGDEEYPDLPRFP